jgi:hypothetical protein
MEYSDIIKYTASLTDAELIQCAETAHSDLHAAEPETEWQESCFAGLLVYCDEMGRRGLKRDSLANGKDDPR